MIFWAAFSAVAISGLVSCGKEQEPKPEAQTHTVSINVSTPEVGSDGKTGITLKMVPNWKNTALASIHVYENGVLGITTALDIEQGKPENGTITAEFPDGGEAPFIYNAVVASCDKDGKFIVPAVQTPNAESLIDPNADFIVGQKVSESDQLTNLAIAFKRPIAVSRACFANFADLNGDKLLKVEITSTDNSFSGSAAYGDINFAEGTVSFTRDAGTVLTISYGQGIDLSSGFNYVYFTCLPGTYNVKSMTVYTKDADGKYYKYEKISNKEVTFSNEEFKNINVNMNGIEKVQILKPGAAYYELETASVSNLLTDGTPYIIVNADNNRVFKPVWNKTEYSTSNNTVDVTVLEKTKIEATTDLELCQITFEKNSSSKYYIFSIGANDYLYLSGTSSSTRKMTNDKTANTIGGSNGTYTIQGQCYLRYSSGAFSVTGSSSNLKLYKLADSREAQTPTFGKSEDTYDMASGSPYVAPTLTGVKGTGTVTYSSSNDAVATVNQNGEVTPLKKGTAVITANVEGDENYKPAKASYTLTVKNSAITTVYYTKVTSLDELPARPSTFKEEEAYGDYLFVYEDGNKAYVLNAVCATAPKGSGTTTSNHEKLTDPNYITVTFTSDGIEATDEVKACKLQLQYHETKTGFWNVKGVKCTADNKTYWLGFVDSNGMEAMTTTGYSAGYTVSGTTGNNFQVLRGSNYYFGYSNGKFISDSNDKTRKVSIYQLSE